MANYVGGDKWVANRELLTAGANLVGQTLVLWNGTVPANAANGVMGVVEVDTANGDTVAVKTPPSIVEVRATGTVTKGAYVEVLTTTYTTKDASGVTGAGVVDLASGYPVGKAYTGGSANDTVLIALLENQAKPT